MRKIWKWLIRAFKFLRDDVAKVAISITQHIKEDLDNGTLGFLADALGKALDSKVPAEVIGLLKLQIPKILAVELSIQGLPDNPTEQEIVEFELRVLDAFGVHNQKSKLYSVLAAQILVNVKTLTNDSDGFTFADAVKTIEEAYVLYLREKDDIED